MTNRRIQAAVRVAVAAAWLTAGIANATDGYFSNGHGMKSIGMGGAAVAVAQEPFAGAVNPASAAFLGNEWQLGVSWFSPERSASRTGSGPANESEITGAFMYAANNSVTGPSLFVGFGLPPTTTDSVEMKEYQVGLAYSRKF